MIIFNCDVCSRFFFVLLYLCYRLTLILMRSCYGFMIQMFETDGSRVHENIQSIEFNEFSDMSPTTTEAQSKSKRKRSSRTSSKPPQPRKVMALRSKVWHDVTRLPKDYNRCKCNYCAQEYSWKSADGTSSLSNHLKRCFEYESYLQNQATLSQETTGAGDEEIGQVVVRGFN